MKAYKVYGVQGVCKKYGNFNAVRFGAFKKK